MLRFAEICSYLKHNTQPDLLLNPSFADLVYEDIIKISAVCSVILYNKTLKDSKFKLINFKSRE